MKSMTEPKPTPTPLDMLIAIAKQLEYSNQRLLETNKELRSINSKVGFFVFVLLLAIALQIVASIFR
jgi:hypothetical protein